MFQVEKLDAIRNYFKMKFPESYQTECIDNERFAWSISLFRDKVIQGLTFRREFLCDHTEGEIILFLERSILAQIKTSKDIRLIIGNDGVRYDIK